MNSKRLKTNIVVFSLSAVAVFLTLSGGTVFAQTEGQTDKIQIKGTVYDRSQFNEMQGVSVLSTSGVGTFTDSLGQYTIWLSPKDSIYFSYQDRKTKKFPVKFIVNPLEYDVSVDVSIRNLTEIIVTANSYHLDSLQNRQEYEKLFNYESTTPVDGMKSRGRGFGVGLDFDMFFNGAAKINKSRESVQRYMVEDEKQSYVSHRFNKAIVHKITGLKSPALDTFMIQYRPSYDFTISCTTDFEFYKYISDMGKSFADMWKEEHPDSTQASFLVKPSDTTDLSDSADAPIPGVR